MKFGPEMLIFLVLLVAFACGWTDTIVKNSGSMSSNSGLNGMTMAPVKSSRPISKPPPVNSSDALVGADGNLLSKVPAGVGTRTIEERINSSKSGFGWNSSALLPKTNAGLDSMSPIEFSKGQNFLEPQTLIGSVLDSNRNPNLQLRRDPVIPPKDVGPFLQSTITPDYERKPLDC